MTGPQLAILLWVVGTSLTAAWMAAGVRRMERIAARLLCERCARQRHQAAVPPIVAALGILTVSAAWPVVVPARLYKMAAGKLHMCEGVREARRLGLPVYTDV